MVPAAASAQQVISGGPQAPPPEPRPITLKVGFGPSFPLAHLAETGDIQDGYANPGVGLYFRAFFPYSRRIDIMADLVLPKFKVKSGEYQRDHNIPFQEAKYRGKMLSLGARWMALRRPNWSAYLMASGGMYQLSYERFIFGVETITEGRFRPGGSVGLGVEYPFLDFSFDGVVRYHRHVDGHNFGQGDLAWLEVGFALSLRLTGD
jgi:hypothetical protein